MREHPLLKGIGLGMAAGAVAGAVMAKNEKVIKRTAQKTVKQIGQLAEDAADAVAGKIPQ